MAGNPQALTLMRRDCANCGGGLKRRSRPPVDFRYCQDPRCAGYARADTPYLMANLGNVAAELEEAEDCLL